MIWVFHFLLWNFWESRSMFNSVSSSWPMKPVILTQTSVKATMDSCNTDSHWDPESSKSSYNIVSKVEYVPWITFKHMRDTLALYKCVPSYSRHIIGRRSPQIAANVPLLSEIACIVQKYQIWLRKRATLKKLFLMFEPLEYRGW